MKKVKRLLAASLSMMMAFNMASVNASAATYTVVKGDCLWSIAEQQLNSGAKWKDIHASNLDKISDPNLIYAGQILELPDGSSVNTADKSEQDCDFTVSWTDSGLGGVEVIAKCQLSGEDEWSLSYSTSFGDYVLRGVYFTETDGSYGAECLDNGGIGSMWFDSAWATIGPALVEGLTSHFSAAANSFNVSWKDGVLGTDIVAQCILSGEEDWTLNYETAFGFYTLSGVYFTESDGGYGVECLNDGGLGMWFDSAWESIQPALVSGLSSHLYSSSAAAPVESTTAPVSETHTVTFVYQMDGFENETTEVEHGKRFAAAASNAFQNVNSIIRGYSFGTWYLDAACTKEYKRTAVIEEDTTLYAGWNAWTADEAELYNAWLDEFELQRDVFYSRSAYTTESVQALIDVSFNRWNQLRSADWDTVNAMRAAREALVQVKPVDEVRWYLWDDQIPTEDTSSYNYFLTQDGEFFRPSMNAYLHDDQSTVKGNIIICSGGGYAQRSETLEAWPSADVLFELGYNCYVVNYRISPNNTIDASIDLQRAIRYLKYHAEEKGIGAIDNIAVVGYSAGGLTVMGQLTKLYGNITPDSIYPDYVCDEIDLVNADYKVAAPIYGYYEDSWDNYSNTYMPAVFNAIGTEDGLYPSYIKGAAKVAEMTDATVLHEYQGAPHGFGMGTGSGTSDKTNLYASMVPVHFDSFLVEHFDVSEATVAHWANAVSQYTAHANEMIQSIS